MDFVILDEPSYLPFAQSGGQLLFHLIIRLIGALMLETNDEWAVARRYMSLETLARVTDNVNVHSKVARCDHLKLTHFGGCKAHRRAAPK